MPGAVWNDLLAIVSLARAIGLRFDVAHWFTSWDRAYDPMPVAAVLESRRVPLITWQPHRQTVREIADGVYDDYLRSWARGLRDASGPVYVRRFPEMNGDWVPWNGDPEGFAAAWRHLATLFASAAPRGPTSGGAASRRSSRELGVVAGGVRRGRPRAAGALSGRVPGWTEGRTDVQRTSATGRPSKLGAPSAYSPDSTPSKKGASTIPSSDARAAT